jgi:alcohol dehydrogenase class IV
MLDELVAQAWDDACHKSNPRDVRREELAVLYREGLGAAVLA